MMAVSKRDVVQYPHHVQQELCTTRAAYRQGKKLTAVKVYTVNNESQHLLLCGVPSLGIQDELKRLCTRFGDVKSIVYILQYSQEQFTDAYHVQYTRIQSARYAKRHLDCRSFYGGVLHVCYAPEMESIRETREKLIQRRKEIASRTRGDGASQPLQKHESHQPMRSKKHPALAVTTSRLEASGVKESDVIWKGIPTDIDPRTKLRPAPELLEPVGPRLPEPDGWGPLMKKRKLPESYVSNTNRPSTSTFRSLTATSVVRSSTLRLVPHQVKTTAKRIVYRNNGVNESSHSAGSTSTSKAESSLETTIQAVREKIRAVSVPNVQYMLSKKQDT